MRTLGILAHPGVPLQDAIELAELAEAEGLGIVGTGDNGYAEAFGQLGAFAARTSRVELISCAINWTRTPVTTGWAATTISELADGRFRLGIGAMPDAWNRDWHDISYERPVERMRDFVAATRAAWESRPGAAARHEGPFYRFREYARFDDPPPWPIPVYLGVTRPRMSELAGEIAEGVIFNSVHTADWIRDVNWPAIDRGLERAGRPGREGFDAGVRVYCAISEDEAEAVHLLRRSLAFFLPVPYFHDLLRHAGFGAELERGLAAVAAGDAQAAELAMTDEVVRRFAIAGTESQVREQLRRYEGVADWAMFSGPRRYPAAVYREQMERIVRCFGPLCDAATGRVRL